MKVFTIGFTKRTAESFFTALNWSGARKLIDVRLNNGSQFAGFSKKNDLRYFAKRICGIEYMHLSQLAPTQEMLDEYKKAGSPWAVYERKFRDLMESRHIEQTDKTIIEDACVLCSEERPEHCHRRLVAQFLREKWGNLEIVHL